MRLTREQVRLVDKLAIERYHIPGIVLMENAARSVFHAVRDAADWLKSCPVVIFCGPGNNGGDGLAVARHAHNYGMPVSIFLAVDPSSYRGDALTNWEIVQRMTLPVVDRLPNSTEAPVFVDAIFGTGLSKPPAGRTLDLIRLINDGGAYVIAVDTPSGLDCDTGVPLGECVRATETITFVAEKVGFANPACKQYTGGITVGDIGCPRELIEEVARGAVR
jgi:NAD(P)H-hydrate epimerase